jgi:peptide/nickel transport system substrate-binding protein
LVLFFKKEPLAFFLRFYMKRRAFLAGSASVAAMPAFAQSRSGTLISMSEGGPNALDPHAPGANRSVYEATWNMYDRLITFGTTPDEFGTKVFDPSKVVGEAVDDVDVTDLSLTFRLKRDHRFHDGTVMTAKDIKWSMDRSLAVGGVPKTQFEAVSISKPEQFVVVDDRTFRIDMPRHDKLAVQACSIPTALIYNSGLVLSHATASDPWGVEWTRNNVAGSGAYKLDRWTAGTELVMVRNDKWDGGRLPAIERVIWRTVPSAGTRRALLERGDADLSYDLPPKDAAEMSGNKDLHVISTAMAATLQFLSMNVKMKPFDDVRVRRAVAYALPYDKILEVALYGRAKKMSGGPAKVSSPVWPQPSPYVFDPAKAKALLADAGYPNGFDVTLSFDLSAAVINEPMCVLIQESLGQVGVRVTLDKVPGANWRGQFSKKQLALLTNIFGAWFSAPDYYFWQTFGGANTIFNSMDYVSPVMDTFIDGARFATDQATYERNVEGMIQLSFDDAPSVPLYQPYLNIGTRANVSGYTYWYHRQIDYRCLVKA